MTYTRISDLEAGKYYLIYRMRRSHVAKFHIAKFVKTMKLYKVRGKWVSSCIFEYLSGVERGSLVNEIECFELSEEEFNKHVIMEYI